LQSGVDLGFRPRKWQAECFKTLRRFSILVVHRRGGKTLLAILKLIDSALRATRPLSRYAYLCPELKQAKAVAWDYLKQYARLIPGTKINESETWVEFVNGARVRLYGADNPDSFRGLYFDGVVMDEVAQMQREIWGAIIVPAIADRSGWVIMIGTVKGINLFSELYFKALSDPSWFAKLYTYKDTGALEHTELEIMRKEMTPTEWRQEMECDFNAATDDTLIPIDDARAAASRVLEDKQFYFAPRIMGVDVAWQGGDRSVIMCRQGLQAYEPTIRHGVPEKTFAGVVAKVCDDWRPHAIFIDTTGGYGGEVLSRLQEKGYPAEAVVFSWKASDERFLNLRAEMWFKLAEWIKQGSIPNDASLIAELCAPTYDNDNAANRFKLESKADIKERIGVSPDIADALCLTWASPVAATIDQMGKVVASVKTEPDPYAED
jgi:hypothetical protein